MQTPAYPENTVISAKACIITLSLVTPLDDIEPITNPTWSDLPSENWDNYWYLFPDSRFRPLWYVMHNDEATAASQTEILKYLSLFRELTRGCIDGTKSWGAVTEVDRSSILLHLKKVEALYGCGYLIDRNYYWKAIGGLILPTEYLRYSCLHQLFKDTSIPVDGIVERANLLVDQEMIRRSALLSKLCGHDVAADYNLLAEESLLNIIRGLIGSRRVHIPRVWLRHVENTNSHPMSGSELCAVEKKRRQDAFGEYAERIDKNMGDTLMNDIELIHSYGQVMERGFCDPSQGISTDAQRVISLITIEWELKYLASQVKAK